MKNVSNKTLGIAGIIAAPFLCLEMLVNGDQYTSWGGVFDLVYMLGWMCSIIGLLRLNAAPKAILYIQLGLLTVANIWNIWEIVDPGNTSPLFFIMDFSWPLSNGFMLVTGIAVAVKAQLTRWRRWTTLFVGCWLPFMFLMMYLAGREQSFVIIVSWSILAWSLMGLTIVKSNSPTPHPPKTIPSAL